jgi:hypothetical protein
MIHYMIHHKNYTMVNASLELLYCSLLLSEKKG